MALTATLGISTVWSPVSIGWKIQHGRRIAGRPLRRATTDAVANGAIEAAQAGLQRGINVQSDVSVAALVVRGLAGAGVAGRS